MAFVGEDGSWLRVNPTLCELLEYTESELTHRTFQQITHPDDVGDDWHMVDRVKAGSLDWYTMTKRYITKRGHVVWIKLRVDGVHDDDGHLMFFLSQIVPATPNDAAPVVVDNIGRRMSLGDVARFLKSHWVWLAPVGSGIGYAAWWVIQTLMHARKAMP